ncbi:MAG: HAD family phosphatase [Candidatus Peregrinibacteria bacterium]
MAFSLSSFSALFFDLDGTLLKGSDVHFQQCVLETGKDFGIETHIPRGMSLRYFLRLSFPEKDEEFIEQFQEENKKRMLSTDRPVEFFEDVAPFLQNLPPIPRAIVTNCMAFEVDLTLRHVHLYEHFETIISRSTPGIERGKPHPDMYEKAAEYLSVSPKTCIAFEDSETGLESAKGAGMFTVALDRHGDLDTRLADKVITSFADF